ncbi:MAG: phosphoribosylformimino-5-aminoimidazole carboxamide ribotide isomerase [Lachnospiraceae bacterium]|nr:phosphoribosylformimino-5-aminoimidazole carboxamide ribotide isomerase [Lachnospiraceae bacterium]
MEFRPCIDIHNGKVKQIVGGSLNDAAAEENFVAAQDAAHFAHLYRELGIRGGHVILLNGRGSAEYEATKAQALSALSAYPGGLQAGGGIAPDNAAEFIDAGASAVIVTSYVFREGRIDMERLKAMRASVGREKLVLDLSCRRKEDGAYYIVTDRWQKFTEQKLSTELLKELEEYAAEYLVHAVDVEGKQHGIEEEVAHILGAYEGLPVTYAGGVHSLEDIDILRQAGRGRVNVTIGSALDLFGGELKLADVLDRVNRQNSPL